MVAALRPAACWVEGAQGPPVVHQERPEAAQLCPLPPAWAAAWGGAPLE